MPEEVAKSVAKIRAELESRHNERIALLEENYTNRTTSMKAQLQNKLTEGKEKYRQAIASEHEQAIENLKLNHEQELASLRMRHRDEIDEMKRREESRVSQLSHIRASEHPEPHDGPSASKAEQSAKPITEISEADAKVLIQSNNYVRGVLRTNVSKQVEAAKEAITAQIKEEHEKELAERLNEAQAKANIAKEQAVTMETKKNALKVNMAENKMKNIQAKIDVVQTAAGQTPSKPVAEVWEVAKDVKASTTLRQPQPPREGPPQQLVPSSVSGRSTSFGQPSAVTQGSQAQGQTQTTTSGFGKPSLFGISSSVGQPSSFGQPSAPAQNNLALGQKVMPTGSFGQSTLAQNNQPQTEKSPFNAPQGPAQQRSGPPSSQSNQSQAAQNRNSSPSSKQNQKAVSGPQHNQAGVNAPHRPLQGANNPFSQGTGPAALRGLQQSGLPVVRGGSRGGSNQRGRGQGRGGPQSIDTSRVQIPPQGRSSPQGRDNPISASLNANAKQFVPGNKRPREDGQEYDEGDSGSGKRLRG